MFFHEISTTSSYQSSHSHYRDCQYFCKKPYLGRIYRILAAFDSQRADFKARVSLPWIRFICISHIVRTKPFLGPLTVSNFTGVTIKITVYFLQKICIFLKNLRIMKIRFILSLSTDIFSFQNLDLIFSWALKEKWLTVQWGEYSCSSLVEKERGKKRGRYSEECSSAPSDFGQLQDSA